MYFFILPPNLSKKNNKDKPKLIIANTIKGKGFSFSENSNEWHHKILTKNQYDKAIEELNNKWKLKKKILKPTLW